MWFFKSKPMYKGRIPSRFAAKIERHTSKGTMTFNVHVGGYFMAPHKKVQFTPVTITVDGIKNMNIRHFYANEIKEVNEYALKTIYPALIGGK